MKKKKGLRNPNKTLGNPNPPSLGLLQCVALEVLIRNNNKEFDGNQLMDLRKVCSFIHHEWRKYGTWHVPNVSFVNISSKWVSLYYNFEVLHSNFEGK